MRAVARWHQPRVQGRPGGRATGGSAVGPFKSKSLGRKPIKTRGAHVWIAITSGIGRSVIVGKKQHDVRQRRCICKRGVHAKDNEEKTEKPAHLLKLPTEKNAVKTQNNH